MERLQERYVKLPYRSVSTNCDPILRLLYGAERTFNSAYFASEFRQRVDRGINIAKTSTNVLAYYREEDVMLLNFQSPSGNIQIVRNDVLWQENGYKDGPDGVQEWVSKIAPGALYLPGSFGGAVLKIDIQGNLQAGTMGTVWFLL